MSAIAVLGANGQVGSEVCLGLMELGVPVVAVVRTEVGKALLTRAGVPCRVGDPGRARGRAELFDGCDTVADFSLPRGLPSEIEAGALGLIQAILTSDTPPRRFVYMSSTMAFGMPSATDSYQHHAVSRTHYAFWKRKMERSAHKLGTRSQISVFRLGQVHGELQTVTRETATRIRAAAGPLCVTNSESDIVLASTIALALRATHCDEGEPGDYSLVDVPAWRLDEFYRFAAAELDSDVEIETVPAGKSGSALRFVSDWIGSNREAMVSHLLPRSAAIEWRAKANWALKRTRAELAQLRPVITARTGPVPGARLALSATRDDAVRLLRATRARIHRAFGHGGHVFRLAAGALPVEPPREPREIRG